VGPQIGGSTTAPSETGKAANRVLTQRPAELDNQSGSAAQLLSTSSLSKFLPAAYFFGARA